MRSTASILAVASILAPAADATAARPESSAYLHAVRTFADNVLRYGRDTYGPEHSPLFVDGLNVDTHEPVVWRLDEEHAKNWNMPRQWILSNFASQQHLLRVLVALTDLTGDPKYKQAAVDATRYAFDHLRHESGLLFWGGHTAWALDLERPVGEGRSGSVAGKHELKCNLPFYEFLWQLDPAVTARFIDAFWANHILRWDILDMNRHGRFKVIPGSPWDHDYTGGPVPFEGRGLTFLNTGCDLIYAAAILSQLTGDDRPLRWAKRMGQRYADVRHPKTGLGADNYSVLTSHRIQKQFEPEYGDRITEATFASLYGLRFGRAPICYLKLYERLGEPAAEFKQWALEDLAAFAKYSYDSAANTFWPMIIDGTRLTPADRKRDGYISTRWLSGRPADGLNFWAYALACKHSRNPLLWKTMQNIARALDLGDPGAAPDARPELNYDTSHADVHTIFALLDLYKATNNEAYLRLARRVGDNLLAQQFHKGFFVDDADHIYCKFDTITPLALLHLDAALNHRSVKLPDYAASKSYFHCAYEGAGRTYDIHVIYTQTRPAQNK
jgi:pectate lyase